MKKSITIRIPERCHEDWNKMTPTQQGKFCNSCAKEVYDFTNSSDETLIKKVLNNENLCGRFKASQINREMKLERRNRFSLAPLAASLLMPFSVLTANPSNGNNSKDSKEYVSLNIENTAKEYPVKAKIITTGRITDSKGKPVAHAQIKVKGTSFSEVSGLQGDFKITSVNDATLIISKKGYKIQEVTLNRKSTFKTIHLILDKELEIEKLVIGDLQISEQHMLQQQDSISKTKQKIAKIFIGGTVVDENNIPIPGVNIIIKNTPIGTQTDFDGHYTIEAQQGNELEFSYIGFENQSVILSNIDNEINITLIESSYILGDYIVGLVAVINEEESVEFLGYSTSSYNPEPAPWRQKAQQSFDNEKEFSKIKRERKKKAKELKRKSKK